MDGRWRITNVQEDYIAGSRPCDDTPVVPCDEKTIDRVYRTIARLYDFSGDFAHELVFEVLKLAGDNS